MDLSLFGTTILPGDVVGRCEGEQGVLGLGPGLHLQENGDVVAIKPGLLKHNKNKFWIDTPEKRVSIEITGSIF